MPEPAPPTPPADPAPTPTPDVPPALRWPAEERRRGKRRSASRLLHCLVILAPGDPAVAAMLLDVSRFGVGLLLPRPVDPGATLAVLLPEAGASRSAVELAARCVHCAELSPGRCLVGAELRRPLGEEELASIVARMEGLRTRRGK